MLEEAVKLDPEFALAYIALGQLRLVTGDDVSYYQMMAKAKSLRARLSHREALLLDASLARYDPARRPWPSGGW